MLCFRNFLVAKNLMDKSHGNLEIFRPMFFCVTVPKNFVGEPFRVSLIQISKNVMLKRVISRYFVEFF